MQLSSACSWGQPPSPWLQFWLLYPCTLLRRILLRTLRHGSPGLAHGTESPALLPPAPLTEPRLLCPFSFNSSPTELGLLCPSSIIPTPQLRGCSAHPASIPTPQTALPGTARLPTLPSFSLKAAALGRAAELSCTLHQDAEMHSLKDHISGVGQGPTARDSAPLGYWDEICMMRACCVAEF